MVVEERTGYRNWFFVAAAAAGFVSVAGGIFDIYIGTAIGGLGEIPEDAVGRFAQFARNPWLGLYCLDLLNCVTTFLLLFPTLAICLIHRTKFPAFSVCTLVAASIGTALFVGGNSALAMLALSRTYETADEVRRLLLAAAGEALIARGEHGGPAVFPAFMLCSASSLLAAVLQLKGGTFGRACAVWGIVGNVLLMVYLVLVSFVPGLKNFTIAIAAPGGIAALVWTVLTSVALVRFSARVEDAV